MGRQWSRIWEEGEKDWGGAVIWSIRGWWQIHGKTVASGLGSSEKAWGEQCERLGVAWSTGGQ